MSKPLQIYFAAPPEFGNPAVRRLITEAAKTIGAKAVMIGSVESRLESSILQAIATTIKESALVIADVSGSNPNVMFEVGLAMAADRPVLLMASSSRVIPFGFAGARFFIYGEDEFADGALANKLASTIQECLTKPTAKSLDDSVMVPSDQKRVFISYAHVDVQYLQRLVVHLKPLERDGLIEVWEDTRLRSGDLWRQEIQKALDRSGVAVLVISADFLASEFIVNDELPPLLRNAENRGVRIIPIIVKPCRFVRDAKLRHFQAVNRPEDALILLSEGEREAIYDKLANEVERSLGRDV